MAEKCTNTSSPVERWMNPYPFAPLNHFTVPFSLTRNSFRLIAKNYSSVSCLFAPDRRIDATGHHLPDSRYRPLNGRYPNPATPPRRYGKNSCWRCRALGTAPIETAPLDSVERLPATKYGGAAKTKARYPTADTATSILLRTRQQIGRASCRER